MKLILRADVENLGNLGDVVNVRPGYGRNFLLPQGLAMVASEANLKVFELERKKLQERMDARASADPWDNTLAYAYADDVFHGYLYALPAGMGIEFDMNTYIADPEETIYSRYAMVNHGTDAEARLLADGWQPLISTEDLIVYERPDTQ